MIRVSFQFPIESFGWLKIQVFASKLALIESEVEEMLNVEIESEWGARSAFSQN